MISSYYTTRRAQTTAARIAAALAVDVAAEGDDHGTAQERAIAGGIQPHSIGDIYPLCVVGIANGDRLHFEVHNLQTDEVMCGRGDVSTFRRQWDRAVTAYAAAAGRAMAFQTVWLPRSKANLLK